MLQDTTVVETNTLKKKKKKENISYPGNCLLYDLDPFKIQVTKVGCVSFTCTNRPAHMANSALSDSQVSWAQPAQWDMSALALFLQWNLSITTT